jgi:adenylate kinase
MQPQTFIFFGPSGCGKGTQAKLLMEELKKKDPERNILYIESGQKFREISQGSSFTAQKIKEIMEKGGLPPVFLPIWIWAGELMSKLTGNEHIFFDGVSRRLVEANVLDSALKFYDRKNLTVLSFEVSNEWATKLMKGRGRLDDTDEEMKKRLAWYQENTVPAIEYFKNDPDYRFITINGEQTIEEVHQEVMEKVGLTS